MIDAWLLFTLVIPFAEVLLHTRMEQLKQKLEQLENRSATSNVSQASTQNQVQPQSETQSITNSSMASTPLDNTINVWRDDKDRMNKKLRYKFIFLYCSYLFYVLKIVPKFCLY